MLCLDESPYLAWCVDQAVAAFGFWVEAMLDEEKAVRKNGKVVGTRKRWRLGQLLGTEKPEMATAEGLIAAMS